MKKKIIIVDDHPIVLSGLKNMIESISEYELVAALSNPLLVYDYLKSLNVDLLVTDIEMPQMNGIELTKVVKKQFPEVKILILTMHGERSKLDEAVSLGVNGYLLKDSDKEEFIFALKTIFKGKQFFSSSMIETGLINNNQNQEFTVAKDGLSNREIEVLKLIAEGYSNIEIGEQLFLSPKTIDNHRTNLMKKLEVHNVVGLVKYAIKNNIINLK